MLVSVEVETLPDGTVKLIMRPEPDERILNQFIGMSVEECKKAITKQIKDNGIYYKKEE